MIIPVPCPRELVVEKKLSRSALVSWSPPEESFVAVSQYHVCVDGAVRAIVPGSYKVSLLRNFGNSERNWNNYTEEEVRSIVKFTEILLTFQILVKFLMS